MFVNVRLIETPPTNLTYTWDARLSFQDFGDKIFLKYCQ